MILARTELATIDALRASGEEPERILELIESIVNKGIDTGRFDMCHVETDPEAALRLAEALLGTNRYPAFARAMRILGSVRISVSGEVIPGAAQRGCPLYLRCSMPDLMR